jgi:Type I phosphodiesterase / nucleotide pyrophosphatase
LTSARRNAALLGLALVALMVLVAAARPIPPPLVVISIDGLRPRDVLEADARGLAVPNLRRLVAEGAHATGVRGVLPTVTYPSHTTLVTGVSPSRHGILANRPFDPTGRNAGGWYWYAEDIRVPTLWDVADRAGLVTSAVDWPVTVGAGIRYNIVQYWRTQTPDPSDEPKLGRALSTPPGLLEEAERVLGSYPSGRSFTVEADARRAAFNAYILETRRPRLHLCYFSGLDEAEHESGPGSVASISALERIDALVGLVRRAAERAGRGRAIVAVVSDHGFALTRRELELGEALLRAGLVTLDARGRVAAWRASVWGSEGSAAIVLRDPNDDDARRRVARILGELSAATDSPIERVLTEGEARALGGFPGAAFVVGLKPDARLGDAVEGRLVRPADPEGAHGQLPSEAQMDATFIVAGPGVPAGRDLGRIDMRDVAPTLAALLGLHLPAAEGRNRL